MGNGLSSIQITMLTWLVYGLITFLTVVTGWQQVKLMGLPDNFVRLEQYRSDENKVQTTLSRIEKKLDAVIMSRTFKQNQYD